MKIYKIRYKLTKTQKQKIEKMTNHKIKNYIEINKTYYTLYKAQKALEKLINKNDKDYIDNINMYIKISHKKAYIKELSI